MFFQVLHRMIVALACGLFLSLSLSSCADKPSARPEVDFEESLRQLRQRLAAATPKEPVAPAQSIQPSQASPPEDSKPVALSTAHEKSPVTSQPAKPAEIPVRPRAVAYTIGRGEQRQLETILERQLRTLVGELDQQFRERQGKVLNIENGEFYVQLEGAPVALGAQLEVFRPLRAVQKQGVEVGQVRKRIGSVEVLGRRQQLYRLRDSLQVQNEDFVVIRQSARTALILPMDARFEDIPQLQLLIPQMLQSSLTRQGTFRLVRRDLLNELLRESELTQSGLTVTNANQLGKLYNAELLVFLELLHSDTSPVLVVKVVDTETSLLVGGAQVAIPQIKREQS